VSTTRTTTRILVLGGGFGGIHAAVRLEKMLGADSSVAITLVSRDNFFLFTMMVAKPPLPDDATREDSFTLVLHRIRSEFLEMPGLHLTPAQAARLWALDRAMAERILDSLTAAGFLFRHRQGSYLRATVI